MTAKYVNGADLIMPRLSAAREEASENAPSSTGGVASSSAGALPGGDPDYQMIELLFFAYREFTGDADQILARYGFGRAHHRVLHFVSRAPGMTIADLLDLLQITKQSLSRVLRQLIDEGFISQSPGREDKRQRCLYSTDRGRELVLELSRQQARRIEAALAPLSESEAAVVAGFLSRMAADRRTARQWLERWHFAGSCT